MATHAGGENAEWRFARAATKDGALAVAGDKMSIRTVRLKISASVDMRDPRPVLPLAHGDPSAFPAFRTAREAEDAVAAALRTGKFNCYPAGVGLPDARRALAEHLSSDLPYKLSTDDIFLTAGGTQAIEVVVSVLAQPGTNILLPRPGYPNYETQLGQRDQEIASLRTQVGDVQASYANVQASYASVIAYLQQLTAGMPNAPPMNFPIPPAPGGVPFPAPGGLPSPHVSHGSIQGPYQPSPGEGGSATAYPPQEPPFQGWGGPGTS